MLSLADIEAAIRGRDPRDPLAVPSARAAVAVVIRESERGCEVLLMRRAERAGDRWSGQVSFPGGREQEADLSLLTTAIRETREEVAVDLERTARCLGRLDAMEARSRGGLTGLCVFPYVFAATRPLTPAISAEAEAVFWLPLEDVRSGALNGVYPYTIGQGRVDLPCWNYSGHTVWGMTHMMLSEFLGVLSAA